MKKVFTLMLAFALVAGIGACSNQLEMSDYEPSDNINVAGETPDTEVSETTVPHQVLEEYNDNVEDGDNETIEITPTGSNIHGALHRVVYGDNVAYLFGTFHRGLEHWFPLADIVEDALRRADIVAVEAAEVPNVEELMFNLMFLSDGLTWVDILPEPYYNHFVELLEPWGMGYEEANIYNPSFLIGWWANWLMTYQSNLEFIAETVDLYIENIAYSLGIPVIGLFSLEQELNWVFNPPFEVMLAQIMQFLPPDEMIEYMTYSAGMTFAELAYFYGNNAFTPIINGHVRMLDNECLYATYEREVIGNYRSTNFANEIIRLLQETEEPTTFFVAVGLNHIIRSKAGEEFTDIVQQLNFAGFTAVPIWE